MSGSGIGRRHKANGPQDDPGETSPPETSPSFLTWFKQSCSKSVFNNGILNTYATSAFQSIFAAPKNARGHTIYFCVLVPHISCDNIALQTRESRRFTGGMSPCSHHVRIERGQTAFDLQMQTRPSESEMHAHGRSSDDHTLNKTIHSKRRTLQRPCNVHYVADAAEESM